MIDLTINILTVALGISLVIVCLAIYNSWKKSKAENISLLSENSQLHKLVIQYANKLKEYEETKKDEETEKDKKPKATRTPRKTSKKKEVKE